MHSSSNYCVWGAGCILQEQVCQTQLQRDGAEAFHAAVVSPSDSMS